jgi:hypothetical protein
VTQRSSLQQCSGLPVNTVNVFHIVSGVIPLKECLKTIYNVSNELSYSVSVTEEF